MTDFKRDQNDKLDEFLSALTGLSQSYRISITGTPILFVMEDDDFERTYSCDDESKLDFI